MGKRFDVPDEGFDEKIADVQNKIKETWNIMQLTK